MNAYAILRQRKEISWIIPYAFPSRYYAFLSSVLPWTPSSPSAIPFAGLWTGVTA